MLVKVPTCACNATCWGGNSCRTSALFPWRPFGAFPLEICFEPDNTMWSGSETDTRLRTNGVNTNGAAAKVNNVDRLRKKVRPGTFGNIEAG